MIETHPFGNFIPPDSRYLFLGSFTAKAVDGYDWFFANKRNQFWPILQEVYGIELNTKAKQQQLFTNLKVAIADIILSCERKHNSNLDTNLTNIVFNTQGVKSILQKNKVEKIFFSSRFVENLFQKHFRNLIQHFPQIKLVYLPSPSPRYAAMTRQEKVDHYKQQLPKLKAVTK